MIGVPDFIDETGGMARPSKFKMLIIDRICHFISSDIGLTLKIQKTVNKTCHRLIIFESFMCFDIFECYDCNAVYSL